MTEHVDLASRTESFVIGTGGTFSWYCVEEVRTPSINSYASPSTGVAGYVACRPIGNLLMIPGTGASREWWTRLLPKHATSVADQLRFIKRQIGLTITELARVSQASRPTIYSWLEGHVPSVNNTSRIARLYAIALKCEATYKHPIPSKAVLKDGRSLTDALADFDGSVDEMMALLRELLPAMIPPSRRDTVPASGRTDADRVDSAERFVRIAGDMARR